MRPVQGRRGHSPIKQTQPCALAKSESHRAAFIGHYLQISTLCESR